MRIGIFYGTSSGATCRVARRIAAELEPLVWQMRDVADLSATMIGAWLIRGYRFDESTALLDGTRFVGLLMDARLMFPSATRKWSKTGLPLVDLGAFTAQKAIGIDEDIQPQETDVRIYAWLAQAWNEFHQSTANNQRRGA